MDNDAEKICRSCHGYQVVSQLSPPEPMQRTEPPTGPWQDVAIDIMGPLHTGENLLVIVDYYSRFFEVVIMQSTTTEKIIGALIPIFARYGYPFSVKSDNGSQFQSEEFKSFLLEHGVEHHTSPPLWPQANGEVERQNRTLLKALKVAHVEGKGWKGEFMKFLLAYRTTPQVSTGVTPAYLMFGRELKTKLPELRSDKNILDENVRDRDWNHKLTTKAYADSRRGAMLSPVLPGEEVLLKNTKTSGKLSTNFEHTRFTVEKKEGQELTVRSPDGVEYRRNSSFVKQYTATEGTTSSMVNQRSSVPDCAETGGLQANTPRKSPSMSTPM